jgi:hypothetical protein
MEIEMTRPFDFASDPKLPPALAARMQAVADSRAAAGLISEDGQTHRTAAQMALYNSGYSLHSKAYRDAGDA